MLFMQYILPQKLLTRLISRCTRWRLGRPITVVIRWFVKRYKVEMNDAAVSDVSSFDSFNAFFTRELKPGARPIQADLPEQLISPVDGAISAFGTLDQGRLLQAKGCSYTVESLLAANDGWTKSFNAGGFLTAYLSPRDYHRIHMPIDGKLESMYYVPGKLFSVNQQAVAGIPGLFTKNERVVCLFQTQYGRLAVILIGAMLVGNMETVWHGPVNPDHSSHCASWDYSNQDIRLSRGDELGRFNMGSTVILLTESSDFAWQSSLVNEQGLQMGQLLGAFEPAPASRS